MRKTFFAVVSGLALAACVPEVETWPRTDPIPDRRPVCPVGASDWSAWVNLMPGPDMIGGPRMTVVGTVTLPPGGPAFQLEIGEVVRGRRPVQELRLTPAPWLGITGRTQELRIAVPAVPVQGPSQFAAVSILCGGRQIAHIQPELAH